MKAIEILVKEHDSILKMIQITQNLLNSQDDKTKINIDHVEKIIDFIRNFADKYHHLKEEDMLFVEMENQGMSRENGPIAVMLMEHDEGRSYIKQAAEAVEKFKLGDQSAFDQLKDNLLNYCTLLSNHINKENSILYPMAKRILPDNIQLTMSENFEKFNSSTIHNEYYDKYLELVDEFSKIYIN